MFIAALALTALLALAPASTAARSHSRRANVPHKKFARRQNARTNPSNLSSGSTTVATGCTAFHTVPEGQYCYMVADEFKITLAEFYSLNPQIDSRCSNMYAGDSYCVAGTPSPSASISASSRVIPATDSSTTPLAPVASETPRVVSSKTQDAPVPSTTASPEPRKTQAVPSTTYTPPPPSSPAPVSSSAAAVPAASPVVAGASSFLAKAGVTAFGGPAMSDNTNGIASWYRADNSQDSTNGHSWCGYPYSDTDPIFAPSYAAMVDSFAGDQILAGVAYCGLEALITMPNGKTTTLYIGDSFSAPRTPSSIDVMTGAFPLLYGSQTSNKNDVVQGVSWKLTGSRNAAYAFKGYGYKA